MLVRILPVERQKKKENCTTLNQEKETILLLDWSFNENLVRSLSFKGSGYVNRI